MDFSLVELPSEDREFHHQLRMGIYGGTLEVFRNMIAQHTLGLGRSNYSPPNS
jgi:hypothetical protein